MAKSSRVFNICQYEKNPKTGEDLGFNEDVITKAIEKHKSIKRWAWICHDKDVWMDEDERKEPDFKKSGEAKPRHWHVVLQFKDAYNTDIIASWFNIAPQYVDCPKGRGAFIECVEYLTHEHPREQAKGKHKYEDSEVHANFDFRAELQELEEDRNLSGRSMNPTKRLMFKVRYNGITLKEVRKKDAIAYMENEDKFKKYRMAYIQDMDPPRTRVNYYVYGGGGEGKGLICRALARALFPYIEDDYDIFFEVGAKGAAFEGYDGQPVIIWNDRRAIDLLTELGGRGNVFNVFDTHPTKQRQNVKYASINLCNVVNIVNSVQPYDEFLDGLAGEYTDRNGDLHEAEDKAQPYRRFWFIIPISVEGFKIMVNKGVFYGTGCATEFEEFEQIKYSFKRGRERLGNRTADARRIESEVVSGVINQHKEIVKRESANPTDEEVAAIYAEVGLTYSPEGRTSA